ncbi:hypothetical protein CTAYLR_003644 [Chrysophaeum taylorii]|uniref:DUF155 domain-containing protein n=1 Tax=Chrysophaeum taylorii TaxID=2483200 RepID=A0AAD7UCG1_9STRA|nr:hypothetical protein CTAYLR_003644 [Chrysophaeum taylorii]
MLRRWLMLMVVATGGSGLRQPPSLRKPGGMVRTPITLAATAPPRRSSSKLTSGSVKKGENTRRLKRVQQQDDDGHMRVSVYAVGEDVDCEALLAGIKAREVRRPDGRWHDAMLEDALHSQAIGCVVLWGFAQKVEREIVSGLLAADYVNGTVLAAERVEAHDTMIYRVDGVFGCKRDVVRLESDEDSLEKLSVSYAMAQSARLFVWEARVAATINELQDIPARLAETGTTDLDEKEISMMIGKVFLERAQVNLATDILDSPDFLWEDDLHEPKYRRVYEWLDVQDRVALLNQRLDVMKDLLDVLNTQLTNNHSSKLELIIICLIAVEIFVTVLAFALDRMLPIPMRGL